MITDARIEFAYDSIGRGELRVIRNGRRVWHGKARTGSVNARGRLVHACPPGRYAVVEPAIYNADVPGMRYRGEPGWWVRLWEPAGKGKWASTHLGFHFDEGGNGTKGCIGTVDFSANFAQTIDRILEKQTVIHVEVRSDIVS